MAENQIPQAQDDELSADELDQVDGGTGTNNCDCQVNNCGRTLDPV